MASNKGSVNFEKTLITLFPDLLQCTPSFAYTESMALPTSGGIHCQEGWQSSGILHPRWITCVYQTLCHQGAWIGTLDSSSPTLSKPSLLRCLIQLIKENQKTCWGPLAHCSAACITGQLPYYFLNSLPWQSSGTHSMPSGLFDFEMHLYDWSLLVAITLGQPNHYWGYLFCTGLIILPAVPCQPQGFSTMSYYQAWESCPPVHLSPIPLLKKPTGHLATHQMEISPQMVITGLGFFMNNLLCT